MDPDEYAKFSRKEVQEMIEEGKCKVEKLRRRKAEMMKVCNKKQKNKNTLSHLTALC